ncbi:TRAP transporter substrate-binding protein [Vibrio litoralis]|uniref:TRAP transporter substrate-binding protein n=1 Tax=Vibrio litoralis TaxID=335972 RepID=UPI000425615E|nr:TRAP transporter substrate-binding protein [Vibrio litoralis]
MIMNKFKKLLLIAFASTALFGCNGSDSDEVKPIKLKLAMVVPDNSNYAAGARALSEEVKKATDGRILVDVYAGGTLGGERDTVELAMANNLDIAAAANAVMTNFIPEMAILDQAYLWDNIEQAHAAVDGELGKLIKREALKHGLHVIGFMESGFRDTFSKNPINTIDDFKGVTIRTMENSYHQAAFKSFGAMPVAMPSNEVFTGLQQGTIDAAENAVSDCLASGFYEVTKNITYTKHAYVYILLAMSDKGWNKIPEDLRAKFQEGVDKGVAAQRELLLKANADATEILKEKGVTFHSTDINQLKAAYEKMNVQHTFDPEWQAAVDKAKSQY